MTTVYAILFYHWFNNYDCETGIITGSLISFFGPASLIIGALIGIILVIIGGGYHLGHWLSWW